MSSSIAAYVTWAPEECCRGGIPREQQQGSVEETRRVGHAAYRAEGAAGLKKPTRSSSRRRHRSRQVLV